MRGGSLCRRAAIECCVRTGRPHLERRSLCWPALLCVFLVSLLAYRPLQLVAARDVGLAAANAISSADPGSWAGQRIPLAGDELTPLQMCAAFSKAQGGMPVKHSSPPAWIFWFLSRCVCVWVWVCWGRGACCAARRQCAGAVGGGLQFRATNLPLVSHTQSHTACVDPRYFQRVWHHLSLPHTRACCCPVCLSAVAPSSPLTGTCGASPPSCVRLASRPTCPPAGPLSPTC